MEVELTVLFPQKTESNFFQDQNSDRIVFNLENKFENQFQAEPASNHRLPRPFFFLPENALENLFRSKPASNQRLRRIFFCFRSDATNFE
jgi:hypothetical protein